MIKIIPFVILVLFLTDVHAREDSLSGGEGSGGRPGDPDKVTREIKLAQVDNMFLPSELTVSEGETVRFIIKNGGSKRHEMLIGSMAELEEAARKRRKFPEKDHVEDHLLILEPTEQKELIWQFTTAGIVSFACPLPGHFKKMRGTITVEKK